MFGEGAYANRLSKVRFLGKSAQIQTLGRKGSLFFSDPHCWLLTVAILKRMCAASGSETAYATSQTTGSEQQHWSDKIMIQHNGTL